MAPFCLRIFGGTNRGRLHTIILTELFIERKTLISVVIFSDLLSLSNIPGSIASMLSSVAGGGAAVVGEPAGQGGDDEDIVRPTSYLPIPNGYQSASSWQ